MTCTATTGATTGLQNISDCAPPPDTRAPSIQAPSPLLPSPFASLSSSSDVGAQLAALIMEASHDQKEAAKETRAAAETSQRAAEEHELEAMKDEANMRLTAGLFEGTAKIASGVIGITGAPGKGGFAAASKSWSTLAEGSGKVGSAIATHSADMSKREATGASQAAGREKRAVDDARDLAKDAKEQLDRALSYYKEYLTAKNDTQKAALLRA